MGDPIERGGARVAEQQPCRVLVTGASGFIGRALLPALAAEGHDVTAATWRLTPDNPGGEAAQREALAGCDRVIHLAAEAHQRVAGRSLESLRAVNVEATLALAHQARAAGVRHFIFMSSIGVLGQSSPAPLDESAPVAPTEPYARSKAEAEAALWSLADDDMAVSVVRPPLVHGPHAPGNFGRLLDWAHKGMPLPLAGITDNRRSLLGLHNLVDFLCHLLVNPHARNQTFHVCDDETVSTAGLLRVLARATGREPRLFYIPPVLLRWAARVLPGTGAVQRLLGSLTVDNQKAYRLLGWRPPWTLEQGLSFAVSSHQRAPE
ncbi:NAD-dependent epimerase/dehydratase [Spiribacter salinus M19-40]|uniref:NAD-dependent epimerase/dehydratase n=1 Tax=Spiribacter salinus M19-40 TaxID=1260251 RepID=R4V770_9GAMM|nr:NAD-dependent epimerase/dehydratase family protein [Spiribacter salinus]AGM41719.1 NAD-dependent epimerase/dehydratase [Spiribacter salinus M19-40]